jgi:hypothetical protein
MDEIPTMLIKTPQGPVRINVGDFDASTMEAYEEPAAAVPAEAAPASEPEPEATPPRRGRT